MAFTITTPGPRPLGIASVGSVPQQIVYAEIVGDGSTAITNGFALTAATYGLTRINAVAFTGCVKQGGGGTALYPSWDRANGKVILSKPGAAAGSSPMIEAVAADFATTVTLGLLIIGD